MGWCAVTRTGRHAIFRSIDDGSYFYFLHSYALPVSSYTIATADHANTFSAISCRDNFVAAQFHPERSSAAGSKLLANFVGLAL